MSILKAQLSIWMRSSTNKKKTGHVTTTGRLFVLAACSLLLAAFLGASLGAAPRSAASKVAIRKLRNGNYQLLVNRKPYIVKGVCYSPIPLGQDYSYDFWGDPNKAWAIDGELMNKMGVNTVRFYRDGSDPAQVRKVIGELYRRYGIRSIMGSWLGFWDYPGPFYADKNFQDKIKQEVLTMVNNYKDEPGILLWILGNENNYSFAGQVNPWSSEEIDKVKDPSKQREMKANIYYTFVNDLAREIKKIDPNHPVALGNGELIALDLAAKVCPDVDLVACIIYRGKTFGNLFNSLKATFDKPILLSEFGADAYDAYLKKEDQNMQAFFLESQWRQVYQNLAGNKDGAGNCLGGTVFEWTDEWWKSNECDQASWGVHDTHAGWSNGSYYFDIKAEGNKNMNEEWFGIVALSDQMENGVHKRVPRKAYYVIREFWKNPVLEVKNNKKAGKGK